MKLYLENKTGYNIVEYEKIIRMAAAETLRVERVRFNPEISVCIVDPVEIRELNKQHRGIDAVTDCLSFPLIDFTKPLQTKRKGSPRGRSPSVVLGDVILCFDRAMTQARDYDHGIIREIAFLTAHSVLHLMGYDHESPEAEKDMFAKQESILNNLGIHRGESFSPEVN